MSLPHWHCNLLLLMTCSLIQLTSPRALCTITASLPRECSRYAYPGWESRHSACKHDSGRLSISHWRCSLLLLLLLAYSPTWYHSETHRNCLDNSSRDCRCLRLCGCCCGYLIGCDSSIDRLFGLLKRLSTSAGFTSGLSLNKQQTSNLSLDIAQWSCWLMMLIMPANASASFHVPIW